MKLTGPEAAAPRDHSGARLTAPRDKLLTWMNCRRLIFIAAGCSITCFTFNAFPPPELLLMRGAKSAGDWKKDWRFCASEGMLKARHVVQHAGIVRAP